MEEIIDSQFMLAASSTKDQESDRNEILRMMAIPIQTVGIFCNIIVLWVWSSERGYVPSTYLFKALAVSDLLYLFSGFIFTVFRYAVKDSQNFGVIFIFVFLLGNQKNGVVISLLLAATRFIKLFFPHKSRRLLSRSRIRIVFSLCLTYSIGLQTLSEGLQFSVAEGTAANRLWNMILRFGLPFLVVPTLQIVTMVVVLIKFLHQKAKTAVLVVTDSSGGQSLTQASLQPPRTRRDSRQFVYVVFAICFVTFLAYEVSAIVYFIVRRGNPSQETIHSIVWVIGLACAANSTVNIVFYMLIPGFRLTLKEKFVRMKTLLTTSGTTTTTRETDTTSPREARAPAAIRGSEEQGYEADQEDKDGAGEKVQQHSEPSSGGKEEAQKGGASFMSD